MVWRDRLVWIGPRRRASTRRAATADPLLAAQHHPDRALETLERAGRPWRIVCTSGSLSGLRAAALAGLGVTIHARGLIPEGLAEMPDVSGLPDLGNVEFVVLGAGRTGAGRRTGGGDPGQRRGTAAAGQRRLSAGRAQPLAPGNHVISCALPTDASG